jgi:predicted nucleotidyltransferase
VTPTAEHGAVQTVQTKAEVLGALHRAGQQLRALGVRRLGLFGSFARGEQSASSDVDLLVEFEVGRKSFDHFMELSFLLEDILRRRVEIVTRESLSRHIGPHILREVEDVPFAA